MKRHAIAMMFIHLSGTGMHCDDTVHFSADLSLWLYNNYYNHDDIYGAVTMA